MRIIAGERRGLILKTCDFEGFRPTLDRVKESLFGTLTPHLEGARVLDLFAGSGALGLEAVSRGAASALLIDNDPRAARVIEKNLAAANFGERCRFVRADFDVVGKKVARGERFDLVFADPPYFSGLAQRVIDHVYDYGLLTPDGLLCLELARKEAAACAYTGFEILREKKYGSTQIWIMRRNQ